VETPLKTELSIIRMWCLHPIAILNPHQSIKLEISSTVPLSCVNIYTNNCRAMGLSKLLLSPLAVDGHPCFPWTREWKRRACVCGLFFLYLISQRLIFETKRVTAPEVT